MGLSRPRDPFTDLLLVHTPSSFPRQKLPPKRPCLPAELFDLKASSPGGGEENEEEEEEEEESNAKKMQQEENGGDVKESTTEMNVDSEQPPEFPDGTKGI